MGPTPVPNDGPSNDLTPLRIQAAAVVAQQAALVEDEWRLQQQRTTLERQQEQVANHLDERHEQLLAFQAELSQTQLELQQERAIHDEKMASAKRELATQREEVHRLTQAASADHDRLVHLRKRFLQRWKRHWSIQRRAIRQEREELIRERGRLAAEREKIDAGRLRFNGTMEIERRQLAEQFQRLEREQAQLLNERNALAETRASVEDARRQWEADRAKAEHEFRALRTEADGIETRIRNGRSVLESQEARRAELAQSLERLPKVTPVQIAQVPPPSGEGATELRRYEAQLADRAELLNGHRKLLEQVAEKLADQRWHLVEQFGRLLDTHQQWQREEWETVVGLEELARELESQEGELRRRQEHIAAEDQKTAQRRAVLAKERAQLEAQWLRYHQHDNARRSDEQRTRVELDARAAKVADREETLAKLLRGWSERRQVEMDRLRAELTRCAEMRERWSQHLEREASRETLLTDEQRKLAEQALVLEQARQELLGRGEDAGASQKKLDRLQRRLRAALDQREAEVARHRDALRSEREAIESRFAEVQKRSLELLQSEAAWSSKLAEYQSQRHTAERCEAECRADRESWEVRQESYEKQVSELREEVDRLAMMLIDAGDTEDEKRAA